MSDNDQQPVPWETRRRMRTTAKQEAAALRLVGAAITVAAVAKPRGVLGITLGIARKVHGTYEVPAADMERLIAAAREAGFKI